MGWPQIVVLVWVGATTPALLSEHDQSRQGIHDAWRSIAINGAFIWVLWMGGFFGS